MKLSILNLAPVREGQTYLQAVDSMVNLAKHAERIGIERYWIAEHHNMKNLVSSATALLIQHTLANTKTWRDVTESFALCGGRAIWHTGDALSKPCRTRFRACARN